MLSDSDVLSRESASIEFPSFFETSAVLLTLILIGRLMNEHAKGRTSRSLRTLIDLQARTAVLVTEGADEEIDVQLVQRHDILKIVPGAQLPTDGVVLEGNSCVDESMLTGEPLPVRKKPGSKVVGGSLNQFGTLMVRVTRCAHESTLSQICNMVEDAQTNKAPVQHLADRVAYYFTPAIILVSAACFVVWYMLGRSGHVDTVGLPPGAFALAFALAVLVVSCPCAIALAVPTAVMVATGVSARFGLLLKGGPPIEALSKVTAIILDKTGTVTAGVPKVVKFVTVQGRTARTHSAQDATYGSLETQARHMWRLITAAETSSEHHLGRALAAYGKALMGSSTTLPKPKDFQAQPGEGLLCQVDGRRLRIGKLGWFDRGTQGLPSVARTHAANMATAGVTVIGVAADGVVLGLVGLADVPRPESAVSIEEIKRRGIEVWMATGDEQATGEAVAAQVGITRDHVLGGILPGAKADLVRLLQSKGHVVAMVGDGINDSVALATADVGVGMGGGTDIALETAEVVLLRGDLRGLLAALQLSTAVMTRIKWNFVYAFVYNLAAMPFAAGVFFPLLKWQVPVAAAGMSEVLSSVPVVLFSLLLNRFQPRLPDVHTKATTAPALRSASPQDGRPHSKTRATSRV